MKLAAAAPRYGWTDLVYSLFPNGHHSQKPGGPAAPSTAPTRPTRSASRRRASTRCCIGPGFIGTTLPALHRSRRSAACQRRRPVRDQPASARATINSTLPSFISDRSAYYQNDLFAEDRERPELPHPDLQRRHASPTRSSRRSRTCGCPTASRRSCPSYPIQQYFGDYEHFVQNKAKEWGDICGADHHVCTFADYPGGDVNATPTGLVRTGVTTRLNRFIDHYAQPAGNPSAAAAEVRRDGVAADLPAERRPPRIPANEPGPTRSRPRSFCAARALQRCARHERRRRRRPTIAAPNPHASQADPVTNVVHQRRPLPGHDRARRARAWPSTTASRSPSGATMIGATKVTRSTTRDHDAAGVQLNARLYDVLPGRHAVMVDRGPYRVDERERHRRRIELHGNGWRFPAGHRIRIEMAQDDAQLPEALRGASTDHDQRREAADPGARAAAASREDYKNAAKFCQAERAFLGEDAFGRSTARTRTVPTRTASASR